MMTWMGLAGARSGAPWRFVARRPREVVGAPDVTHRAWRLRGVIEVSERE